MIKIFYILFICLFVIFYIIACVSPVASPIGENRNGTYKGTQPTLQKRWLTINIGNGGVTLGYKNTNAGTTSDTFEIYSTNISGIDPYYSFQNTKGAGTLKFISSNKVIVTFRKLVPDYYVIGETTCRKQP